MHVVTLFKKHTSSVKGFVLPFTMLLVFMILLIFGTSSMSLSKQLYFSKLYRQSQVAYYSADDAMMCATIIDTYIGIDGYGIFPGGTADDPEEYMNNVLNNFNNDRIYNGLTPISRDDIECNQVHIFNTSQTSFEVSTTDYVHNGTNGPETGKTSSFSMRIPVGDGTFRCALVTINKTPSFRQIIAQGYAQCDKGQGAVERAIVNTTVVE
jgi:hypothetical protein